MRRARAANGPVAVPNGGHMPPSRIEPAAISLLIRRSDHLGRGPSSSRSAVPSGELRRETSLRGRWSATCRKIARRSPSHAPSVLRTSEGPVLLAAMYPEIHGDQMAILPRHPIPVDPAIPPYVSVLRLQIPPQCRRHTAGPGGRPAVARRETAEDRAGRLFQPARFRSR